MRYLTSFRDMVRELHRAGIEVVLDVVFNHTGEGGVDGPTQCFRGIDNPVYARRELQRWISGGRRGAWIARRASGVTAGTGGSRARPQS